MPDYRHISTGAIHLRIYLFPVCPVCLCGYLGFHHHFRTTRSEHSALQHAIRFIKRTTSTTHLGTPFLSRTFIRVSAGVEAPTDADSFCHYSRAGGNAGPGLGIARLLADIKGCIQGR